MHAWQAFKVTEVPDACSTQQKNSDDMGCRTVVQLESIMTFCFRIGWLGWCVTVCCIVDYMDATTITENTPRKADDHAQQRIPKLNSRLISILHLSIQFYKTLSCEETKER
jgi:hypothetical protein